MNTGDKFFFDLITEAGLGGKKKLQTFVDSSGEFYNKLDISGFPFSPDQQIDFGFEQISKEYGMNAMATWTDVDSPGTPVSLDAHILQTGKIPRQKKYAAFSETDYRKMAQRALVTGSRIELAQDALLETNKKLIDSHTNSNTYMRHQMVSTGGFELTADNNAGGVTGMVFSASIPEGNKIQKSNANAWFISTGTGEGASSDPVKDLLELAEKAKGTSYHFEVDALTLKKTLSHSKVLQRIGYSVSPTIADADIAQNVGANLLEPQRKERLEAIIGYPIVAIDSESRVEKFNKKTNKIERVDIRSFNEDSWALIPNGNIGETLSVAPLRVGGAENFASYYGGRLLLTYEFIPRKKEQIIESEMSTLVVPTTPNYMYMLKIK